MTQNIVITVNGEPLEIASTATLADVLQAKSLDEQTHATAVNGLFVARAQRSSHVLQAGDAITCFQAIVGG